MATVTEDPITTAQLAAMDRKMDELRDQVLLLMADEDIAIFDWTWERAVKALQRVCEASDPLLWRLVVNTLAFSEQQAGRLGEQARREAKDEAKTCRKIQQVSRKGKRGANVIDLLTWARQRVGR